MDNTTKCGLFFLGGLVVGALGAVAITRGELRIKPLASDLVSGGLELRDKLMAGVESVREDIEDVVAEAQVKNMARREAREAAQTQAAAPVSREDAPAGAEAAPAACSPAA